MQGRQQEMSQYAGDLTAVGTQSDVRRPLPPGQRPATQWKVVHYGPIPRQKARMAWDITVFGATASGREHRLDLETLASLPQRRVRADLHCVNGFSILDLCWEGVPAQALLDLVPPAADARYVLAWAEYGYSANLSMADFAAPSTLIATRANGEPLTPDHGGPARLVVPHRYAWKGPKWLRAIEYRVTEQRGFWEERGYHNVADPWSEARYAHQE